MTVDRQRGHFGFDLGFLFWFRRYFWQRHYILRIALKSFLVLGFLAVLAAAAVAVPVGLSYYEKAQEYDPIAVAEFKGGGLVYDSQGELVGSLADDGRILLRREQIPDHFVAALMAAEDARFMEHRGFDPIGITRAAIANFRKNGIAQGGSTITQQLARNSYDLGGRTIHRKLVELFFAIRIEKEFTKDEIVTHYLNRVYFGSGFWGLGAAAKGYFDKSPEELTVAESAMLSGLIRRPNTLSPFNNPELAEAAKDGVLKRMVVEGSLEPQALGNPEFAEVSVRDNQGRNNRPRYLLGAVRREAREILQDHSHRGLLVETSINSDLQAFGESVVADHLTAIESQEGRDYPHPTRNDYLAGRTPVPDYLQGAAVVLENRTGRILAAVGSRDLFESSYDRVALSKRQAGTAFHPFVYAAAYESGAATPMSAAFDAPMDNREVMLGGQSGILGEWGDETLSRQYLGRIPSGYGLISGKNAATVRLGFQTGIENVHALSRRAGIRSPLPSYPSSFLGAGEVSLLELAHAYTTFPNDGWRTGRTGMIDRIVTGEGEVLYRRTVEKEKPVRAFSERTARQIKALLAQAVREKADENTADRLRSLSGQVAGMPGTSVDSENNWFVGFNDRYTWGVWVGMDRPQPIYRHAFSRDTALPMWARLAAVLDSDDAVAGNSDKEPELVPVCLESFALAHEGCTERGHRYVGLPDDGSYASLDFCRAGGSRGELSEKAEAAEFRATPVLRATPVSANPNAGPRAPSKPVAPEVPPLSGENVFGILDGWSGMN